MGYVEIVKGDFITIIEDDKITTTPARTCDRCNKKRSREGGRTYNWSDGDGWDWWCAECIK
jgi:hypothetical protein